MGHCICKYVLLHLVRNLSLFALHVSSLMCAWPKWAYHICHLWVPITLDCDFLLSPLYLVRVDLSLNDSQIFDCLIALLQFIKQLTQQVIFCCICIVELPCSQPGSIVTCSFFLLYDSDSKILFGMVWFSYWCYVTLCINVFQSRTFHIMTQFLSFAD